jgi:hypothetical protein
MQGQINRSTSSKQVGARAVLDRLRRGAYKAAMGSKSDYVREKMLIDSASFCSDYDFRLANLNKKYQR